MNESGGSVTSIILLPLVLLLLSIPWNGVAQVLPSQKESPKEVAIMSDEAFMTWTQSLDIRLVDTLGFVSVKHSLPATAVQMRFTGVPLIVQGWMLSQFGIHHKESYTVVLTNFMRGTPYTSPSVEGMAKVSYELVIATDLLTSQLFDEFLRASRTQTPVTISGYISTQINPLSVYKNANDAFVITFVLQPRKINGIDIP